MRARKESLINVGHQKQQTDNEKKRREEDKIVSIKKNTFGNYCAMNLYYTGSVYQMKTGIELKWPSTLKSMIVVDSK